MSIISLAQGDKDPITAETLRSVASKYNFTIPEHEEQEYLLLLNAADSVIHHVNSLPEYHDPRLEPSPTVGGERKYWKVKEQDNPLNNWSHSCNLRSKSPLHQTLLRRSVCFKDNVSVGDLPHTCGTFPQFLSRHGRFPISQIDASVVRRVLKAGGEVKGTATCENFSMCPLSYSSASGPVHNPWLPGYSAGGSSSGCASLVAVAKVRDWRKSRGLDIGHLGEGCDLAVGGDQGGSIRLPAAYCGVYGLKPTHGLIPYTGIAQLHPMIDHCGPMAASVRDVALLLSVLAGYDGIDPRMTPETPLRSNVKDYAAILDEMVSKRTSAGEWTLLLAGSGLKVGILKEGWEVPGLSSDVALVVKNAAERFTLVGAKVEEVSIPFHKEGPAIWTAVTRAMMADYATRNIPLPLLSHPLPHISPPPPTQEMYTKLSHHNPAVINVLFNSAYIRSEYGPEVTAKAVMHVHELRAAYDTALETYDILITPVTLTVAPKHPMESDGVMARINQAVGSTSNTCPFNVTGHPALSMPVGWGDAVDGNGRLPIGMQIIGKRWDEETILKAALMWEVGGLGLDNE